MVKVRGKCKICGKEKSLSRHKICKECGEIRRKKYIEGLKNKNSDVYQDWLEKCFKATENKLKLRKIKDNSN